MKNLLLAILIITFISCKKESKRTPIDIQGNWSSIEKKSYQELYFDKNNMFVFSPYSGNFLQYEYIIRNDSIFRVFKHPEIQNQEYEYYDRIMKIDSERVVLEYRDLIKLIDSNSLEMYIKNEIDYKIYDKSCSLRENFAIPLDSLGR